MRKILLVIDEYKELVALENLLRRLGFDVLSVGKDILVNDALAGFLPDIVIATLKGRAVDGVKVSIRVRRQTPAPLVAFLTPVDNAANITQEQKLYMDGVLMLPLQPQTVIRTIAQMSNIDPGPLIGKFQKMTSNRVQDSKTPGAGGEPQGFDSDDEAVMVRGSGPEAEASRFVRGPGAQAEPSRFVRSKQEPEETEYPWDMELVEPERKDSEAWDPVKNAGQAASLRTPRSDRYNQFLEAHDEPTDATLPKEKFTQAVRELKRAAASETVEERDELQQIDEEKREFVRKLFTTEPEKKK